MIGFIRKILLRLLGIISDEEYARQVVAGGGKIGNNVHFFGCVIDLQCPRMISIGNDVTLTGVTLLTHDASLKKELGYSKFGKVTIGNMVFVGKNTTILPNVHIGNHVIIGAGSVVTHDIPSGSVAVGCPCKVIGTYEDFVKKNKALMQNNLIDKLPRYLDICELDRACKLADTNGYVFLK